MLNPPTPLPNVPPNAAQAAPSPQVAALPAQRVAVLFRHVLHTAPGCHLHQLIEQYRKEAAQ